MNYGQPQFQMPPLTRISKFLIIGPVVLFILNSILVKTAGINLVSFLGLAPAKFFSGHIYELVTYPLVGQGLMSVLFDALLFWFLGCELERIWGEKRFISFLLTVVVLPALIYSIVTYFFFSNPMLSLVPIHGMTGVAAAMCLAYGILFPDRMFSFMMIFPVKARYFCMLLVGICLYSGFFSPSAVSAWVQILGMICAFIWIILVGTKGGKFSKLFNKGSDKKKGRANLRLVDDEEGKNPRYWQ